MIIIGVYFNIFILEEHIVVREEMCLKSRIFSPFDEMMSLRKWRQHAQHSSLNEPDL